jgi:hypothetical protein
VFALGAALRAHWATFALRAKVFALGAARGACILSTHRVTPRRMDEDGIRERVAACSGLRRSPRV